MSGELENFNLQLRSGRASHPRPTTHYYPIQLSEGSNIWNYIWLFQVWHSDRAKFYNSYQQHKPRMTQVLRALLSVALFDREMWGVKYAHVLSPRSIENHRLPAGTLSSINNILSPRLLASVHPPPQCQSWPGLTGLPSLIKNLHFMTSLSYYKD